MVESKNEKELKYQLKDQGNGVYFMLIDGKIEIEENILETRDAIGVWNILDSVDIVFHENSKLLAIEVPMN